ncbi:hypothetical protein NEHOM01_2106 [Nematocida homosporus]|uniref:uncharacterized protein n=1 Tax=Nematocida homosporus TaxID=1912981 RepID=UPI00221F7BC5|nr:uncharacterized protein NEHOM01_2106 [Nematocida homosporus]KAI5187344.1 hypothetical protein NEHOM01_2106 [Nematocida homosporus]
MTTADETTKFDGLNIELVEASSIRKKHMLIKGEKNVYKLIEITDITKSKPGKHGAAKLNFTGVDLSVNRNITFTEGTKDQVTVGTFKRTPCLLLELDEQKDEIHLFNEEKYEDFYLDKSRVPAEALAKLGKVANVDNCEVKFILIDTPYVVNIVDIVTNVI